MKYNGLVAIIAALGLGASACNGPTPAKAANDPASSEASTPRMTVGVAIAHQQDLIRTAQAQGALFPKEKAVLATEVPGAIAAVYADLGDQVKPGQVLLRIDAREYQLRADSAQAQLEQAQARLANSSSSFERMKEMNREHLVSGQQFDQASSEFRVAQADTDAADKMLGLARKRLSDTYIRAPFAGFVQKRSVSLGEHVGEGMAVYELIATNPIKLRAQIPERFVPMAKVGIKLELTIDARPGQTFYGTVTRIAPALDDTSRTLLVEAEVPNPDGTLKPGYFAHVTLNLGHDRALFVPEAAVLRYAGVARVFVFEDGVAKSREITTGAVEGDQIEIVSGLKQGEKVVVTDVDRLADGTPVIAKEQS
ncbi:MAG TPA: efflux RND transporter periplasmic adaptor subunit [Candidatus Binataceae bacterium]|nr:efflux RND transporter periplasmic adaptor subunit [Candidatus Binataceae bacterium]